MMIDTNIWFWVGFNAFVLAMLALDLGVFHRKAHVITAKEAGTWTAVWVSLALVFAAGLYFIYDGATALTFLTGYVLEESLSADNIFVIVLIFSFFRVPQQYQHRVLFWGIVGALLMRGAFIALGTVLLDRFHWITYVFGAMLLITGVRMLFKQDEEFDAEKNPVLRLARRFLPVTDRYDGQKFFTKVDGKRAATPLFLVLLLVEVTDLIFAVDSIPAIFGVTRDPFLVYTSNIFAVLGLRSLYFLLAGVIDRFHFLKFGLALILVFIGAKMVLVDVIHVPVGWSLLVILLLLAGSIVLSLMYPQPKSAEAEAAEAELATRGRTTGSLFGSKGRSKPPRGDP